MREHGKILKVHKTMRGVSSSSQLDTPALTGCDRRFCQVVRKFVFFRILMDNGTSRYSTIPQRNASPYLKIKYCGQYLCRTLSKPLPILKIFPLNVAIWSQFACGCLWDSFWAHKESRSGQKDGDTRKFSKHTRFDTICETTSGGDDRSQRRIQHANSRLEHISMVKNYVDMRSSSKMDPDESSCVLRFHLVCWSQIQVHLTIDQRSCMMNGTNMDLSKSLAAREVQFTGHVLPGASSVDIKGHIQRYLNGENPEYSDKRITFISKGAPTKSVCFITKKQHLRNNKPGHWCAPWSPPQKIRGGLEIPMNLRENEKASHCTWLTLSSVILPNRNFQRQSHYHLDSLEKEEKFQVSMYVRQKASHQRHIGKQFTLFFAIEFVKGMGLKIGYPHEAQR